MFEEPLRFSPDPGDWALSALLVLLWCACAAWMLRKRPPAAIGAVRSLIVHASQTGHAADIAERTQLRIEAAGEACALVEADRLTAAMLSRAEKVFFVVSTTGEGEAPDNARHFEKGLLAGRLDLSAVRTAVVALGDRRYPAFCAFGRRLDEWVRGCGATMLSPLVEIDDLAPGDLALWDQRLAGLGYPACDDLVRAKPRQWRIAEREQVAGDADGELITDGLYRIVLRPAEGALPPWEIGDLFELHTPDGHVRDYSIASRPDAGEIRLFVRRVVDKGVVGRGSGCLTDAEAGSAVIAGHVRTHRSFHTPTGDGPLLAVGAGSGWAGLRPHLLHAMALGQPCRLIFGERASEEGGLLLSEMRSWEEEGRLDRLDLALSRGEVGGGLYVQHVIAEQARAISEFLGDRGRIILCGRLAMGEQSLSALAGILGRDWIDRAQNEGRLRRDLY